MTRRSIATFLIIVMIIGLSEIKVKASGLLGSEEYDLSKCVLYAQDNSEAIIINASNVSVNGDIISGGNITINSQGKNVNGTVYDTQDIYMLRLLPNIERQYLEDSDYYEEYISETFNENISKSRYISDSFQCENMLSVNNSAVVTGGDVVVKNQVTNMNNGILCSIIGDIHIEANNISVDGIVYAPMGTVYISGDNINISGIIIAQKIEITGRYNVNVNRKPGKLETLLAEVPSAVKYGAEDTDEIDIGEVYCKSFNVEEDIIYAGKGIYCIKNQILLSVREDVAYSVVEELAREFDASIVGYIELTNDYQIEIRHEVDINELNSIKDRLSTIPYILSADYNQILEEENQFHTNDDEWDDSEWDEESRAGKNAAVEAIRLKSALEKCGVIEDDNTTSDCIKKDVLYNVKIGIIDSGFDVWNQDGDLTYTKVWNNYESLTALKHTAKKDDGSDQVDYHGTLCAGVMAAGFNNWRGIAGICVKNRLYAYSKNNPTNNTSKINDQMFNEKCALALLIGNNVRVISRSLGNEHSFAATVGSENAINEITSEAAQLSEFLKKLINKGYDFIIVNSAGNQNDQKYYKVPEDFQYYRYDYIRVGIYNNLKKKYDIDEKTDTTITAKTYGAAYSNADITIQDGKLINVDAQYGSPYGCIKDTCVRNRIVIVGAMQIYKLGTVGYYDGKLCKYSNRGKRVDVCALGEWVWTCDVDGEGEVLSDGTRREYRYGEGTSIAAPQVAGALGLAYSVAPSIDSLHLVNVLKRKYTDYHKDDGFQIKYANAEELVSFAINYHNVYSTPEIMNEVSEGLIMGSIADYETKELIEGVNIGIQKVNENGYSEAYDYEVKHELSDAKGLFMISVPSGDYKLIFQKDGYYDAFVYISVELESTTYVERIYLTRQNLAETKDVLVTGYVLDALNGLPVEGAIIKFKQGWDNREGQYTNGLLNTEKTVISDDKGCYYCILPIGLYTAEITKEGYYKGYTNIIASPGNNQQYSVLTPIVKANEYRVVLTWGELPSDLDSHLMGTLKGTVIHVSYLGKEVYSNGSVIASLDYDDTTSYGPETITFTIDDINDTVKYYVHDYSNGWNDNSYELSYSNAKVMVYGGDYTIKPKVYNIPVGKQGTIWNVFEIRNNEIIDIDSME